MNNYKDLIHILTDERKKLGISQNKLAKKVGVYNTTISRIEKLEMNPTLSLFLKIADVLGYEIVIKKKEVNENVINTDNIKKR